MGREKIANLVVKLPMYFEHQGSTSTNQLFYKLGSKQCEWWCQIVLVDVFMELSCLGCHCQEEMLEWFGYGYRCRQLYCTVTKHSKEQMYVAASSLLNTLSSQCKALHFEQTCSIFPHIVPHNRIFVLSPTNWKPAVAISLRGLVQVQGRVATMSKLCSDTTSGFPYQSLANPRNSYWVLVQSFLEFCRVPWSLLEFSGVSCLASLFIFLLFPLCSLLRTQTSMFPTQALWSPASDFL